LAEHDLLIIPDAAVIDSNIVTRGYHSGTSTKTNVFSETTGRLHCWYSTSEAQLAAEWKQSTIWHHHWAKVSTTKLWYLDPSL